MKMIFVFICLMLSQLAFGNQFQVNDVGLVGGSGGNSSIPAAPVLTLPESSLLLGGMTAVGTVDKGWFHVYGGSLGGGQTTDNVQVLYKNGVQYSVPSGATAHIVQVCGTTNSLANFFQVVYGDNAFANNSAVGSVTNIVYEGGATVHYQHNSSATVNIPLCTSAFFNVPAGKYIGAQTGGASATASIQFLIKETVP